MDTLIIFFLNLKNVKFFNQTAVREIDTLFNKQLNTQCS